jgi:hypothetical protein
MNPHISSVMARRFFLKQLALIPAAAALVNCGVGVGESVDGTESFDTTQSELNSCSKITTAIAANHGHSLVVSPFDVAAKKTKSYVLAGSHTHTVTLTAAHFATLSSTGVITVASGNTFGHTHGVTVTCSGTPVAAAKCANGSSAATISFNHGHSLILSKADVALGGTKTFSIAGGAGHAHTITLVPADFTALKAGSTVTKVSSNGAGHTHSVSILCAA